MAFLKKSHGQGDRRCGTLARLFQLGRLLPVMLFSSSAATGNRKNVVGGVRGIYLQLFRDLKNSDQAQSG
jgi:hypothetical protein